MRKDILSVADLTRDELEEILEASARTKADYKQGIRADIWRGRTLGMYFEKPSLRTRVSQECAVNSLGGSAICLEQNGPGKFWARECVRDQARVMSRFVDVVSMRTFSQDVIEEFAREASIPVVNTLSDFEHPTQAMADFLTMREHFGSLRGRTMTFFGDGNNVARSLLAAAALLGVRFIWSGPAAYRLDQPFKDRIHAKHADLAFEEIEDPAAAVREADVIYTDVWASMGQEEEAAAREKEFMPWQVNDALLAKAPAAAIVEHCLPAHRGSEITDSVMDGSRSAVYDQAENRMHVYRGIYTIFAGAWK